MKTWLGMLTALMMVALGGTAWAQAEEDQPIVREIEVRFIGRETVNRAVVLANVQTTVGKPRLRHIVEQDVRNLIGTGYFTDVRVLEEPAKDGVKVVFQVRGKATIKDVVFEGAKRMKVERLKKECSQKAGDILDDNKAHADAMKIKELYEKMALPDAKVEPVTTIDQDTGKAILKFKITEGKQQYIRRIEIHGNKAFPTQKGFLWMKQGLLTKLKTKRHWWGSWLSNGGVLKQEQLDEDMDRLRDFYRSQGYIDMDVLSNRVEHVGSQWIVLHIDIFEGQQYKVGKVEIEGSKLFPKPELEKKLKMMSKQTFTPDGLNKDVKALEDFYGSRGYLDTTVNAQRKPNVETGQMDLVYVIREGELTYVEKIQIRGNTKTKDKVIRRELAIAPGDIYDTVRVTKSAERLKNLGFFSKVEPTPEPTSIPNHKDLVLNVEEQRTGNMMFGAGFSSIDSLLGFVEVTQGNFDLFNWPKFTGAGQKLRLRAQVGLKRQDYVLSFVEPWFLDQKLSLGFDLFDRSAYYLSDYFSEKRLGGDVRLEKAINEFTRVSVQYQLQNIEEKVDKKASQELQSQNGTSVRSSLETSLTFDSRDSVFLTTRGNRSELSVELVGGPLAGSVSLYKLNAKTTFFFPLFNGHVLELLGASGVVQAYGQTKGSGPVVDEDPSPFVDFVKVNDVPIYDRYFLGGANTLRGFSYRKVGPKDVKGEPIGGNTYANATAEYSFPIVERIRGAFFYDIGNVWENSYEYSLSDLKSDVGIGVRLNLPVGPLRLDYGYPIQTDKQSGHSGKIQFSVGYQF